jgi:beta-glucanase (GH16 family)
MKRSPALPTSRLPIFSVLLCLLLLAVPHALPAKYTLVWADEFDLPDGSAPDPANWNYNLGGGGWGNSELQYYTDRTENARIEGNQLVIEVREEPNYAGSGYNYTSARLLTKGKHEFMHGRIEARIKVPSGLPGLWPAFWTLGANIDSVGWPQCGEIDIMEYISREPKEVFGTIHGPLYSGGASIGNTYAFAEDVANDFHTFAVEWQPNLIRWYVDGILYHSATPDDLGTTRLGPKEWVFENPHFLILNVAIGGTFGGALDPNLQFPAEMRVDYVRVYEFDYGMFNGFPQDGDWINSGDFMGWVNIREYPWVYVQDLGAYIHAAPSDSNSGWIYLPK